jgi:hypothetical protein
LRESGLFLPGYFVCWAGVQSMFGVFQSDRVDSRTVNHQLSQMGSEWSGNPDSYYNSFHCSSHGGQQSDAKRWK